MKKLIIILIITFGACNPKIGKRLNSNTNQSKKIENSQKIYPYRESKRREIDIIHTKLKVDFDWKNKTMNGEATLLLKPYFYPIETIELDAKSFIIHKVEGLNLKKNDSLKYEYDSKKLKISLGIRLSDTDTLKILIKYTAQPEVYAKASNTKGEAISDDKGLYFITPDSAHPTKPYQIWTQGEPESASCWFPTFESTNEKFTQEIFMTVSKKLKTLSNGELIYSLDNGDTTRTDYWKQTLPHAPYLAMMAVGDFEIIKDKWKNIPVNYYVEPAYKKHAMKIFGKTPEMISFFSEKLKYPYPWAKYSSIVVRDYVSGAMENTSATVFMEQVQRTDRELIDQNFDNILAHELFHHWFGDLVTCESWANLPLNESFADYSEYLWEEYKHGVDAADYARQNSMDQYFWEAQTKREPLIRYNYKNIEDMFDSHSYAKGGTILHSLRNYVGEKAFFESLHLYLKKNEYKTAEIHDLRIAFEEVTGQDLNWFFNQWFFKPGHPELKVSHYYKNNHLVIEVQQLQDTIKNPMYILPITLSYIVNNQVFEQKILINNRINNYSIKCDSTPSAVLFDSKDEITANITHPKSISELIKQYDIAPKYKFRYESLDELKSKIDSNQVIEMFKKALNDPFWKIREMAIETLSKTIHKDSIEIQKLFLDCYDKEKDPDVKSTLIEKLSSKMHKSLVPMYVFAMNDSSYKVVAAALHAYIKTMPDSAENVIKKFQNESNIDITLTLAKYYSSKKDTIYLDWFKTKIKTSSNGEGMYSLVQELGDYAMKVDIKYRKKIGEVLIEQAKKATSPWVRYSAFQCLLRLNVLDENYKSILIEIKNNEKHERLLRLYDNML